MISDKYSFVYVRNAKTASTSLMHWKHGPLKKSLTEWYVPEAAESRAHDKHHVPYQILKEYLNAEQVDTYFSFGLVRNPYDRLFSAFNYAKNWYMSPELNVNNVKPKNPGVAENNFRRWLYTEYELHGYQGKYASQHYYLNGCIYVGKFETLAQDINNILKCIGLPTTTLELVNESTFSGSYVDQYDTELKNFVYNTFEEDFDIYQYSKKIS